jgi:hypothetical protein
MGDGLHDHATACSIDDDDPAVLTPDALHDFGSSLILYHVPHM